MNLKKDLKITFLGTGTSTGVPMITSRHPVRFSKDKRDKRLRSSILISYGDINYVVDCGPDFRQQMLRANVETLEGILFTHEHADHIAGLDEIRPFCFKKGALPIYLHERVLNALKRRYDYIFATENRYPSAPKVVSKCITRDDKLKLDNIDITPVEVMHGDLPILGYRFNNIAYLTDIKTVSKSERQKLQGLDVLIITGLRKEPHATHLNIDEALQLIKELKPKKTYLTHISELLGFHEEVEKELPENVFLAYDELVVTVS